MTSSGAWARYASALSSALCARSSEEGDAARATLDGVLDGLAPDGRRLHEAYVAATAEAAVAVQADASTALLPRATESLPVGTWVRGVPLSAMGRERGIAARCVTDAATGAVAYALSLQPSHRVV